MRAPRLFSILFLLSLLMLGCNLEEKGKTETTFNFDRLTDSLKQYDEVVIVIKSLNGDTLDVVFRGKVDDPSDLQKLRAPHWSGGEVIVSISAKTGGNEVYRVDTRFAPETGTRGEVVVFVTPDATLSSTVPNLTLLVGDSLGLPAIQVLPANLLNKDLDWKAAPAGLLRLGSDHIKAIQVGDGQITVSLRSNPSVTLAIPFTIAVSGMVPESVSIQPESLEVSLDGMPGVLTARVSPTGAASAVHWTSEDTTFATVDSAGRVFGKRQGSTSVWATSKSRPSVKASARVKVTGPIAVERIAFATDSMDIQVGATENLPVTVFPSGANPAVSFTFSEANKASVQGGRITALAAGRISVFAVSVSNPAAKDTLLVKISVPMPNDTVPPGRPVVRVNPAGPTQERRPAWSWASGGGGAGAYQISLDKSVFDSTATSLADTAFKPGTNLSAGVHVLYVRERDAAGNWSLPGSAQVEIDTARPASPKIVGASPTSSLPRWTWSSGGGGGAGVFRSRLGNADFPANAPESRDTAYALTSAASGTTYTLYVQERDAAGNWSLADSLSIKYDLTKPTVTFTSPQASGTFITALDTVRVAGSSTGPNGIAALEYSLDGGAATPIALGTGGSWTLASLRIPNAKVTVIKVTATDNVGNKGEAEIAILRDSDLPTPPVSLSNPASPTNVATASWTWAAGGDGTAGSGLSGKYRWKLNAGAFTEVSTAATTAVTLAEGSNVFQVQEQDKAGNWSASAQDTVVLDTKVPDAVTFTGIDGSYTDDATPTWTWAPSASNGGIAAYVLKLDAGAEFDWTTTTFTPTTALSDNARHTLTVRQKDQVPGAVGVAKSFSYQVKVNPPSAPVVRSAAGTTNNLLTNNPKFTWISGGGGKGTYRVRLNSETLYRTHPQSGGLATEWSLAAGDADGTYTIHVSEQDDLGRWGAEGDFTIRLDRTGPTYTEVFFKGTTLAVRDSFVTNLDTVTVTYKADGALKEFGCKLAVSGARTECKAVNADGLGNSSTLSRFMFSRRNVVFFKPTGTGSENGSSWENARDDLAAYINLPEANGKDLWLASGNYSSQNIAVNFKSVNIYGGFNAAAYPIDPGNRIKNTTPIGRIDVFSGLETPAGTLDGIRFAGGASFTGSPYNLKDCQSLGPIDLSEHAIVSATNVELTGVGGYGALSVHVGSNLTWDGGRISGNVPTDNEAYAIEIGDASATFKGNLTISGNANPVITSLQILNEGTLNILSPVSFSCADILNRGTGYCLGTRLPE